MYVDLQSTHMEPILFIIALLAPRRVAADPEQRTTSRLSDSVREYPGCMPMEFKDGTEVKT